MKELKEINSIMFKLVRANMLADFVRKIRGKSASTSSASVGSLGHDNTSRAFDAKFIDKKLLVKNNADLKVLKIISFAGCAAIGLLLEDLQLSE